MQYDFQKGLNHNKFYFFQKFVDMNNDELYTIC